MFEAVNVQQELFASEILFQVRSLVCEMELISLKVVEERR